MGWIGRNLALAAAVACAGLSSTAMADDLSKGVPSKEALQRKTAFKLAGLATFVSSSCPDLKLDPQRFRAAIEAFGVTTDDLKDQQNQFAYLQYTMAYKQDVKANCARARVEFGPQGKTLPDLFVVVDVPSKPPGAGEQAPAAPQPTPAPKAPEPGAKP